MAQKLLIDETKVVPKNTAIVMRIHPLDEGGPARLNANGFDLLLQTHASGHNRWTVLRTKLPKVRVDRSLDPCVEELRTRGCDIETVTTDVLDIDDRLTETAQLVAQLLVDRHVFICTRCGYRERLCAAILSHAFQMSKPPQFVAPSQEYDSGVGVVLSRATVPSYELAVKKVKGGEPNTLHRTTVRLFAL